MRRSLLCIFLLYITTVLMAQGLYYDIGGGWGMTSNDTQIDYYYDYFTTDEHYPRGIGFELGGKIGYNPFDIPLYLVGDISWIKGNPYEIVSENYSGGHHLYDWIHSSDISHLFFGPGIVYYPTDHLQLATSIGMVYTSMSRTDTAKIYDQNGYLAEEMAIGTSSGAKFGFGFNISSAVDFGGDDRGLLIGGKFSFASAKDLEQIYYSGVMDDIVYFKYSPSTVYIGLFIKYRFKE